MFFPQNIAESEPKKRNRVFEHLKKEIEIREKDRDTRDVGRRRVRTIILLILI